LGQHITAKDHAADALGDSGTRRPTLLGRDKMRLACAIIGFAFGLLCAGNSAALAQRPKAEKVELYVVVDIDGELSVMTKTEQVELSKKAVADFKESMKAYAEARKEAAKNKEQFDEPKPVMQKVKAMGRPYKTQELAEAQMEKLLEARERLKEKRGEM
jgi:hypothetical protein